MKWRALIFVYLFLFVSGFEAYGQGGASGTILGTVKDGTGALLPGASIEVTRVSTGIVTKTATGAAGDYTVPDLPPGGYSVTVRMAGFGDAVTNNVTLSVAQQARVDVAMKPGNVTETIQVSAGAVALDTDTSSVSQLVSLLAERPDVQLVDHRTR